MVGLRRWAWSRSVGWAEGGKGKGRTARATSTSFLPSLERSLSPPSLEILTPLLSLSVHSFRSQQLLKKRRTSVSQPLVSSFETSSPPPKPTLALALLHPPTNPLPRTEARRESSSQLLPTSNILGTKAGRKTRTTRRETTRKETRERGTRTREWRATRWTRRKLG